MKALSIRQPWAWLIVNGYKDIENRDWRYPPKFRGEFLIHASKGCTRAEHQEAVVFAAGIDLDIEVPLMAELERGGIVGKATLADCVMSSSSPWFFGRIGFVLADAEPIDFVEHKGQLGFFDVDMKLILNASAGSDS